MHLEPLQNRYQNYNPIKSFSKIIGKILIIGVYYETLNSKNYL